jgi:hypothetical protein
MNPFFFSVLILLCAVGGAGLGLWLKHVLPEHHSDEKSKDVVRVSVGLVVTLVSLLLSLGVSTAKSTFSAAETALRQSASEISQLNMYLQEYGPETETIRRTLYQQVTGSALRIWPELESTLQKDTGVESQPTAIAREILSLKPQSDYQGWLKAQALAIASAQLQQGALVLVPAVDAVRTPFVLMLCFWLGFVFISFGLFAPSHLTAKLAIAGCSFSVAAAVYLVLELEHPYGGWITVSPDPLLHVMARIAH